MRKLHVLLFILLGAMEPRPLWAGAKLLNVQGKLTDSGGNPLAGSQTVTFRLYSSSTVPVASAVWTEIQGITPQSGLFNVTLGNATSLDSLPFNAPYYLGIQVAGDPNELQPRQLLGASGYALGSLGNFNVQGNFTSSGTVTAAGAITAGGSIMTNANVVAGSIISGKGLIKGTTVADDAPAGYIGEYMASTSGPIYTVSGAFSTIAPITLTPGDWDVTGVVEFVSSGICTSAYADISFVQGYDFTANVPGLSSVEVQPPNLDNYRTPSTAVIPNLRVSLNASATIYLRALMYFSSGTNYARGRLSARRVR